MFLSDKIIEMVLESKPQDRESEIALVSKIIHLMKK